MNDKLDPALVAREKRLEIRCESNSISGVGGAAITMWK